MEKNELALNLMREVLDRYGIPELEEKYHKEGTELLLAIYHDMYLGSNVTSTSTPAAKTTSQSYL